VATQLAASQEGLSSVSKYSNILVTGNNTLVTDRLHNIRIKNTTIHMCGIHLHPLSWQPSARHLGSRFGPA
jgi:hypothetical protein